MIIGIPEQAIIATLRAQLPGSLVSNLSGYWSRRIDDANRLIYRASDEDLVIIACRDQYDD